MSESATTPFSSKCEMLGEFWLNYRVSPEFGDFFEYNDLGLPLAYAVSEDIVTPSDFATHLINETFDLLLEVLGVEDTGFENIEDILAAATVDLDDLPEMPDK